MITLLALVLQDPSFAGTWDTTYGEMTLQVEGARVRGSYGGKNAIEGSVSGRKLTFTYSEGSVAGEGTFELAADGLSFEGKWREKRKTEWGAWKGKKRVRGFDGVWDTTFGKMRLVVEGSEARGMYSFSGSSTIEGKVDGKKLTFQYRESSASGEGWFQLSDDASSFAGEWRVAGAKEWKKWEGKRVEPKAGRKWLIVVEARWEEGLQEREYSFGDMLRAFFARLPDVEVRHRFFQDEASLGKWCIETAYLAEPVILVVATHGSSEGVFVDGTTIGGKQIASYLRYAKNLLLLHFSACEIMKDKIALEIAKSLGKESRFPISGYTTSVDWAASALIEFMFFDLILSRNMKPADAESVLQNLLPFAGTERVKGSPFESAGFRLLRPDEIK